MRSSTRCGGLSCALLVACFSGIAAAQGPAPVPSVQGDPPGYRELVDEAVTEHRAGHFGEARGLFMRAHNLYPNARTLKGLGMAEFELRNYRESAQYLEASLASTVKPLTPELRAEAEQLLARAQRFLGKVRVMVSPSTTQIMVDGAVAPFASDGSVLLAAGDHTLEASAAGHEPARKVIKVNGGDDQTVTFQLTPAATAAGTAPPAATAVPLAATAETAPETSGKKPRGFRLYAGGLVGFAGKQSFTFEAESPTGLTGSLDAGASQKVTYGFDIGATFFAIPYFDLGAEVRLMWAQAGQFDDDADPDLAGETVDTGRTLMVDIDIKPRLRFDLADGRAEFYVALPVGLTIPSRPEEDEIDASLGWNLGVGPGFTYYVTENIGLNLEFMFFFHGYSADGSGYTDAGNVEASVGLFIWQPTALLNLVFAP